MSDSYGGDARVAEISETEQALVLVVKPRGLNPFSGVLLVGALLAAGFLLFRLSFQQQGNFLVLRFNFQPELMGALVVVGYLIFHIVSHVTSSERVEVAADGVWVWYRLPIGYAGPHFYRFEHIRQLRAGLATYRQSQPGQPSSSVFTNPNYGALTFFYGQRSVSLANWIDKELAQRFVTAVYRRFPQYQPRLERAE